MHRLPRWKNAAHRLPQLVLIASVVILSWLGMMGVHELGHVLGAWWTGATVERVVLHPLRISRTDVSSNTRPLVVAWSGPILGVLLPLAAWAVARSIRFRLIYLLRFFAGFCLVANGAYIGGGSLARIGDCGELLRHGAGTWQLWLFGVVSVIAGLWLWNGLGLHFGVGPAKGRVDTSAAWTCAVAAAASIALCLLLN